MKKLISIALLTSLLVLFVACANNDIELPSWQEGEIFTLRVGATPRPHAEILTYIAPYLLADGVEIEVVVFDTFPTVNPALADGTIGANYFQHIPFLEASPYSNRLSMIGLVHVEPMGAYSSSINSIEDLPQGAVIAIPNDAVNHGRALLLLQAHGLLVVDSAAGIRASYTSDILENPLGLEFVALDAALLPRALDDPSIDMAIINTNHVLSGTDLNPMQDSLIMETPESPFANGLTSRTVDREHRAIEILLYHLQSERVRQFIYAQYDGAVVPVF